MIQSLNSSKVTVKQISQAQVGLKFDGLHIKG